MEGYRAWRYHIFAQHTAEPIQIATFSNPNGCVVLKTMVSAS